MNASFEVSKIVSVVSAELDGFVQMHPTTSVVITIILIGVVALISGYRSTAPRYWDRVE